LLESELWCFEEHKAINQEGAAMRSCKKHDKLEEFN